MTAKAKVYIKGPPYYQMTANVFKMQEDKYDIVTNLDQADIVVWTGGEDIWPGLYGEDPLPCTSYTSRDIKDVEVVEKAFGKGLFLVGICRGAQLLNCIPNGGTLWQDMDGHNGRHHRTFDCITGTWLETNSVHHQSLRVTNKAQILAWAQEATYKKSEKDEWRRPIRHEGEPVLEKDKDVEAVWYEDTKSLLIQSHPEFGHPPTTKYFMGLLDKFYWGK